jgi:hypothetical protein
MPGKCCSQNRCALITCASCARRYAGQVSQRIRNTATGGLYAIEIKAAFRPVSFSSWRIEARNVFDYRRRTSRWWQRSVLHVWLSNDGGLHGIVALGELTPEEFLDAFGSRWLTTLRFIRPNGLRI